MANLAIKGHATRGNEVIEILEMLGGINKHNYHTDSFSLCHLCFCIAKNTNIIYFDWVRDCCEDEDMLVFTLEEFLEKYPYKVGDKVIYEDKRREITKMVWEGQTNTVAYKLDDKLYCNVVNKLQPYKEEPIYLNRKVNEQAEEIKKILEPVKEIMEEIKLDIPDGYEFFGIDDDNKIVLTKKQPPYPKTYVECAKYLECFGAAHIDGYKCELLEKLQELIICRDAYWKIAGEQMGLGEPWKPTDDETSHLKYVIQTIRCEITCLDTWCKTKNILELPTAEMRDIFYENFKNLIEDCKDLL